SKTRAVLVDGWPLMQPLSVLVQWLEGSRQRSQRKSLRFACSGEVFVEGLAFAFADRTLPEKLCRRSSTNLLNLLHLSLLHILCVHVGMVHRLNAIVAPHHGSAREHRLDEVQ